MGRMQENGKGDGEGDGEGDGGDYGGIMELCLSEFNGYYYDQS